MTKIQNSKPVSVIWYWNLKFVCDLVLGVWDFTILQYSISAVLSVLFAVQRCSREPIINGCHRIEQSAKRPFQRAAVSTRHYALNTRHHTQVISS